MRVLARGLTPTTFVAISINVVGVSPPTQTAEDYGYISLKAGILCLPHPRRETQRHSVGSGEKNGAREETSFQAQAKEPLGAFSPDPTD